MSTAGRVAVIAITAAVAFGAAFFLGGGSDVANDDVASDDVANDDVASDDVANEDVATDPGEPSASSSPDDGDEERANPCAASDVVPIEESPYEVTVATKPDPPVPSGTIFKVRVERNKAPLEGATVCLSSDMPAMSHEGTRAQGEEVGDGRYELDATFGMRGSWTGHILVIEPGRPAASMPISFNVR